ncbi:MAG: class I SAM-dependent methyltransferase [Gemmatimonadota bacterium]
MGAWLRARSAAEIDGVDLTSEMLERALKRDLYRTLRIADVANTGCADGAYDLCIQSLADEHLPDLEPLYREVARVTKSGGTFVIVGFHPQFLMAGVPTHFDRAPDEPVTIRSYVHLFSDHVKAARRHGWSLLEMVRGADRRGLAQEGREVGEIPGPADQLRDGVATGVRGCWIGLPEYGSIICKYSLSSLIAIVVLCRICYNTSKCDTRRQ